MVISSLENDKVKSLAKLSQKKYRDIEGKYLVEGEHLVEEASKAGLLLYAIVLDGVSLDYGVDVLYATNDVLKKISSMDNPPSVIGVCKKNIEEKIIGDKILLLDEIQDPGNLGTIIRSSLAFNIDTIILTEGSVDLYNPKVLRATQGMFFHTNVITMRKEDVIKYMLDRKIPIYATSVVNGIDASSLCDDDKKCFCLAMGNEGNGLSKDIFRVSSKNLYIKMNNKVESLNVGVACSILLYELGR